MYFILFFFQNLIKYDIINYRIEENLTCSQLRKNYLKKDISDFVRHDIQIKTKHKILQIYLKSS